MKQEFGLIGHQNEYKKSSLYLNLNFENFYLYVPLEVALFEIIKLVSDPTTLYNRWILRNEALGLFGHCCRAQTPKWQTCFGYAATVNGSD